MTFIRMVRGLSIGLLFGILALGLLPFLVIFNFAEMLNLAELESSPLFMLLGRFAGRLPNKKNNEGKAKRENAER